MNQTRRRALAELLRLAGAALALRQAGPPCQCGFLDDAGNPWQAWGDAPRPQQDPPRRARPDAERRAEKEKPAQAAATPTGQLTPVPPRPQ